MNLRIATATLSLAFATTANAKLEAHEWGTFTSLVGSNGVTQQGMYHEDEKLPSFVYGFGEIRTAPPPVSLPAPRATPVDDCVYNKGGCFPRWILQGVTQKMETPVIYFYSDKNQRVDVRVRFPKGVVTETFPAPVKTSPTMSSLSEFENGDTTFTVDVLTALQPNDYVPQVDANNIYGHARHVASQYVKSGNDVEKFIFYRGLGHFQPRISMTSMNGRLSLSAPAGSAPLAAYLVHVDAAGDAQGVSLHALVDKGSQIVNRGMTDRLQRHDGLPDKQVVRGPVLSERLIGSLVEAGLNADEAKAMLRTWEHGYLKVPGLRLLYVLPRAEVDEILPVTMTPAPEKFERVFVARIEILLDTEEERIFTETLNPYFRVGDLGRFKEPILRRVSEYYVNRERAAGRVPDPKIVFRLESFVEDAASGVAKTGTAVTH